MRILKTLILGILLIGVSLLTIGWVLVSDRGPELAQEWLFLATGHRAQVREISLSPSRMVLNGVSIGQDLKCARVEIWASWQNLLQSRPEIDRVVFLAPRLIVEDAREILGKTSFLTAPSRVLIMTAKKGKKRFFDQSVAVNEIMVWDGQIIIKFPAQAQQSQYVLDRVQVKMGRAIFPLKGDPLAFRLDGEILGLAGCLSRIKIAMDGEWALQQKELRGALALGKDDGQLVRSHLVLNEQGVKIKGRIDLKHLCLLNEGEGFLPLKALLFEQSALGAAQVRSNFTYEAPLAYLKGGTLRLKGELVLPGPAKEPLAE